MRLIMTDDDRQLGMGSPITRRDFLNGVAVGVGAAMAGGMSPDFETLLAQGSAGAYPPALTGLRGSHVGSFEAFHSMKDGAFWKSAPAPQDTGEEYDLVVVGAGISGLAAAHYFRKARPDARILLLDNHDDFGGHAKRNEFTHNGRTYIGYGGTQSIDSPAPYSAVSKALITELGIDVARYSKVLDSGLYKSLGLRSAFFFDKETYGADRLVTGDVRDEAFLAAAPVGDNVRRDLKRLLTERFDPMPGLSSAEKKARLARMSYTDFITKLWKLDAGVLRFYQTRTHGLFGVGVDAVPAQDAFGLGLPGFAGMGLDDRPGPGQNFDSIRSEEARNYYFHFPDGGATVARLLARRLIPVAIPGSTLDDVVTARADYSKLDAAGTPVRIRLSSPVMRVRHMGAAGPSQRVEITYLQGKHALKTVSARAVVLACWHTVIPSICPELP
ncbi:MAG: NAD(P)/FAD-dependent oxidoreductase, partial [Acidobacteria bacterium]|nr:NAD(P)/FAD-dependent oxidoreductase [Acidobacteriota bacterium]